MLAAVKPSALPALRLVAMLFLIFNIGAMGWIVRNRRRIFDRDSNFDGDEIPAVRRLRVEAILIPWLFVTTALLCILVALWIDWKRKSDDSVKYRPSNS